MNLLFIQLIFNFLKFIEKLISVTSVSKKIINHFFHKFKFILTYIISLFLIQKNK